MLGAELENDVYHVGSDCARVRLAPGGGGEGAENDGDDGAGSRGAAAAWAVCVELEKGRPPRAQATTCTYHDRKSSKKEHGKRRSFTLENAVYDRHDDRHPSFCYYKARTKITTEAPNKLKKSRVNRQ